MHIVATEKNYRKSVRLIQHRCASLALDDRALRCAARVCRGRWSQSKQNGFADETVSQHNAVIGSLSLHLSASEGVRFSFEENCMNTPHKSQSKIRHISSHVTHRRIQSRAFAWKAT